MSDWNGSPLKLAWKVCILIVGSAVTLVGIALLVLPGPAFIVIPAGLAILALEFSWARRWLAQLKEYIKIAAAKAKQKMGRSNEQPKQGA